MSDRSAEIRRAGNGSRPIAKPPGSEVRRALIATALGVALGLFVAAFSRRDARD